MPENSLERQARCLAVYMVRTQFGSTVTSVTTSDLSRRTVVPSSDYFQKSRQHAITTNSSVQLTWCLEQDVIDLARKGILRGDQGSRTPPDHTASCA